MFIELDVICDTGCVTFKVSAFQQIFVKVGLFVSKAASFVIPNGIRFGNGSVIVGSNAVVLDEVTQNIIKGVFVCAVIKMESAPIAVAVFSFR